MKYLIPENITWNIFRLVVQLVHKRPYIALHSFKQAMSAAVFVC